MRLIAILLAGLVLLPLTAAPVMAKVNSTAAKVHVVKSGDSLYEIAQKNGMTVNELKRLNGLSSNRLKLGQKLALNRAAAPPLPAAGHPPAKVKSAKKSAPPVELDSQSVHVVKKGDSLHTIARQHGITVEQLKQLNRLKNNKLQIGQQLALATPASEDSAVAAATPATSSRKSYASREVHVVKKGETLASIARRNHVSVKELKRLNGLRNNNLKIGQQLALNDPYEERNPILLPGDANEDEILEMAYGSGSELQQVAFNFLSTPYRFGGTSRRGIDCSSFVQQVFREVDVNLPRSAREQFRVGTKVERNDLQPGDLVFFRTYARFPSHVGIYLGDNKMIHASSRSRRVVVTSLDYPYYQKRYIGAKRISLLEKDLDPASSEGLVTAENLLVPSATEVVPAMPNGERVTLFDQAVAGEEEELGDAVSEEEARDVLIPPAEKFEPATEPATKPLTSVEPAPAQQTASTLPLKATVN